MSVGGGGRALIIVHTHDSHLDVAPSRSSGFRWMTAAEVLATLAGIVSATGFTPYEPTDGWTYHLEAARGGAWPSCNYRFLSFNAECNHDGFWKAAGVNQELKFVRASANRTFYLKLGCGKYLSVASTCANTVVDTWAEAGINQEFRMVPSTGVDVPFEWAIEAVGRASCPQRYVSYAAACSDHAVSMGAATTRHFRLHGVRGLEHQQSPASSQPCADPFAWHSKNGLRYFLACTGGLLGLEHVSAIANGTFTTDGTALGGDVPIWARSENRWAPENVELTAAGANAIFFSDNQPSDGRHRVGWAMSATDGASLAGRWTSFAREPLDLGESKGGEIDQHVFRDDDGESYLVWKTDDNSVGSLTTRIWAQRVQIAPKNVTLLGRRRELLDSSGLWWVVSFIKGGSLIEGPEIVRRGRYYYLFFAAGRYCTYTYAEGVARATSIWGPYEKLPVPLLSTGITGYSAGGKLTGPGHASFVTDAAGAHYAVYHASQGANCRRYAFVSRMRFSSEDWPYIEFDRSGDDQRLLGVPAPAEEPSATAEGCRIVAPCDALADEPELRVGEAAVCAGQPCRRLGERRGVEEDELDDGAVVPMCSEVAARVY